MGTGDFCALFLFQLVVRVPMVFFSFPFMFLFFFFSILYGAKCSGEAPTWWGIPTYFTTFNMFSTSFSQVCHVQGDAMASGCGLEWLYCIKAGMVSKAVVSTGKGEINR